MLTRNWLLLLLLFGSASSRGWQARDQQTKSGLSQPDETPSFRITLDVPLAQRSKIAREMDAFIWNHWSGRQRAKLRVIAQTKEGLFTFQTIFIEPDAHGLWRMRDELREGSSKSAATVYEYDEVHRIDMSTGKAIPDSENRSKGTYTLLIANKSQGLETPF